MTYCLRQPNGQYASDNLDKYGPWLYDTRESAERMARALEHDCEWPEGSVEVIVA